MAAYRVLVTRELLQNIADFHTDELSTFIRNSRTKNIYHRIKEVKISRSVTELLGRSRDIGLLKVLHENNVLPKRGRRWEPVAVEAFDSKNFPVFSWVYKEIIIKSGNKIRIDIWDLIRNNDMKFLQLLCETGHPIINKKHADYAAIHGQYEIVKLFNKTYGFEWTVDNMNQAAGSGCLPLVQWFHENSPRGCTTLAMDLAAVNGHLHVVQWLHQNRTEGCTTDAMNRAAGYGHFNIVKWLHENRSEGCTIQALNMAGLIDRRDIVEWLLENIPEFTPDMALNEMMKHHKDGMIKWLCDTYSIAPTVESLIKSINYRSTYGVEYLFSISNQDHINAVIDILVEEKNKAAIIWLYKNNFIEPVKGGFRRQAAVL